MASSINETSWSPRICEKNVEDTKLKIFLIFIDFESSILNEIRRVDCEDMHRIVASEIS